MRNIEVVNNIFASFPAPREDPLLSRDTFGEEHIELLKQNPKLPLHVEFREFYVDNEGERKYCEMDRLGYMIWVDEEFHFVHYINEEGTMKMNLTWKTEHYDGEGVFFARKNDPFGLEVTCARMWL